MIAPLRAVLCGLLAAASAGGGGSGLEAEVAALRALAVEAHDAADHLRARELFGAVATLDPHDEGALAGLGVAEFELGVYADSLAAFERCVIRGWGALQSAYTRPTPTHAHLHATTSPSYPPPTLLPNPAVPNPSSGWPPCTRGTWHLLATLAPPARGRWRTPRF